MEVLDTLGVSPVVILIQICIFLGFYFIIKTFLFGPIMKVVMAREHLIGDKNKQMEHLQKKIEDLEQKINTLIAESDKEILAVEEKKIQDVMNKKTQLVTEIQEQLLQSIQKLRETFEAEKNKTTEQLENILKPIKDNVLSKILNRN